MIKNKDKIQYKIAKENFIFFIIVSIIGIALTVTLGHKKTPVNATGLKPWLGVETVELNPAIIKEYTIHSPNGLLTSRIFMGAPAAIAGIKQGDIIRRWNGISITNLNQFKTLMESSVVNQVVKITIDRGDKQLIIYATLGRRPGTF